MEIYNIEKLHNLKPSIINNLKKMDLFIILNITHKRIWKIKF